LPPIAGNLIIAGISSMKQLKYEEKVCRQIVSETGGKEFPSELKEALSPRDIDQIRAVLCFRFWRLGGAPAIDTVNAGPLKDAIKHKNLFIKSMQTFMKKYDWKPRPMPKYSSVFSGSRKSSSIGIYMQNRGHYAIYENMVYIADGKEALEEAVRLNLELIIMGLAEKCYPTCPAGQVEPLTTLVIPDMGPKAYSLWRMFKKIFDPNNVCAPRSLVYTEEEFKALPDEIKQSIREMRAEYGLPPHPLL